tara:strand:+ start:4070 stop:5938 length:1869 start_codon:yes stop_codon:yes gene_type:complete
MSVKKTIDIEVTLENGDKVIKQFEDLGNGVLKLADSSDKLEASFEEVYNGMQPLTTRMGEAEDRLYELALAGDTTSKEYQELLTKVGEYRKVQIQTDLAVDQAATTFSQKLGTALGGATSGFAAVQGVMALTGGESEALEKSLLKVQGALAFQQGIQGVIDYSKSVGLAGKATQLWTIAVGGTTGAMKLLRLALISTGIGALVVLLGTLIANQDKVSKGAKGVVKATDEMSFGMRLLLAPIVAVVEAYKALRKAAQFLGLVETEEQEKTRLRAEEKKRLYKEERDEIERTITSINRLNNRRNEGLEKRIRLLQAAGKETRKIERQILINNIKNEAEILKEKAKSVEAAKKLGFLQLNNAKAVLIGQMKILKDAEFELRVFDTESARIRRENAAKEEQEEKIEFDGKIERLQIQAATEVSIDKEKNEQIAKNAEEARERQKAAAQSLADTEKAIQDARMANIEAGISLFKDLAGENNKLQALAIAAESAVSIAKTIIATQAANAAATAQGTALAITTGGASVAAAAALVTQNNIAAGISIAAQIAAAAKGISALGGGASPASGGSLGGDSGGGGQAPSFNVVGDSGINQLAQLQQAPVQAFVVSGEVTTSQALDRNRVENATL